MSIRFTVVVQKEDELYVAKCAENNVASQGKSIEESIENLKEAIELYYDGIPRDEWDLPQTFITSLEVAI